MSDIDQDSRRYRWLVPYLLRGGLIKLETQEPRAGIFDGVFFGQTVDQAIDAVLSEAGEQKSEAVQASDGSPIRASRSTNAAPSPPSP
jgi:hypothetical protein